MKFIFSSIPAYGHISPMIEIASYLVQQGHEVFFLTGSEFQNIIRAFGVKFINIKSLKYQSTIDYFKINGYKISESQVREKMINSLGESFEEVLNIFKEIKPDKSFIDSATYSPCAVSRYLNLKWATSCAFPEMIQNTKGLTVEKKIEMIKGLNKKYSEKEITELNHKHNEMLAESYDKFIIPFYEKLNINCSSPAILSANISEKLTIVYTSKKWEDYRTNWPDYVHFVGSKIWDPYFFKKINLPKNYIYVTLGTFWNLKFPELYNDILKDIINDNQIVLTTGNANYSQNRNTKNVKIIDFASNKLLISNASFIIHHGGFGTAMSTIMASKPSILIPIDISDHEMAYKFHHHNTGNVLLREDIKDINIKDMIHGTLHNKSINLSLKSWAKHFEKQNPIVEASELLLNF